MARSRLVPTPSDLATAPRWRGESGRLEVRYLTATDEATGTGLWVHHEIVAPTSGPTYVHGWAARFPATDAPTYERFGPTRVTEGPAGDPFDVGDAAAITPTTARGHAGDLSWDLTWTADASPLWTFPRWVWQRQVLPAAQVV